MNGQADEKNRLFALSVIAHIGIEREEMKKPYWWIITTNEKGEEVLIKGAPTESEATSIGYQKISRYFEVKMYPTTSIVEASRYHKGSKLNDTADLDLSMQRLKHTT